MSTMLSGLDVAVFYPGGAPIAFVEVKNAQIMSTAFAIDYRDRLLADLALPWSPYFLIVSQELGYIWDHRPWGEVRPSSPVEFSMRPVVSRYMPRLEDGAWLGGFSLNFIVIQWLDDLASQGVDLSSEPEATLERTGFIDEIRGGIVRTEADQ
ncbi:MAG: hypothetical protein ACRDJH_04950 [Thermomicrobiales bacterium]